MIHHLKRITLTSISSGEILFPCVRQRISSSLASMASELEWALAPFAQLKKSVLLVGRRHLQFTTCRDSLTNMGSQSSRMVVFATPETSCRLRNDGVHACRHRGSPWRVLLPRRRPAETLPRNGLSRGHEQRLKATLFCQIERRAGRTRCFWSCSRQRTLAKIYSLYRPRCQARISRSWRKILRRSKNKTCKRRHSLRASHGFCSARRWNPLLALL